MVMLSAAVARGADHTFIVVDMPFGSYQVSNTLALENAIRLVKQGGADAVKVEGAGETLARVAALVDAESRWSATSALLHNPPRCSAATGPRDARRSRLTGSMRDALALQAAGCFALVLEAMPSTVAAHITEAVRIPTIGIGSGVSCDGRCSCGTIFWDSPQAVRRSSSSDTSTSTARFKRRWRLMSTMSGGAGFRSRSTPTQWRTRKPSCSNRSWLA
jgi:3-methyl-2-oxobutanoate hydroxymethyltransferase